MIKTINKEESKKMQKLYFREGRADIPAFSAYAPFVIPRYFSEFNHFIHMEVDQVARADLAPLWEYCVTNKLHLAAAPFLNHLLKRSTVNSFDSIHPGATCFNTGVLFVDTKNWIDNRFESLCFKELELQQESCGKRLDFYAQGAINNALHSSIHEISWPYNVQGIGSMQGIKKKLLDEAKVLHWTGTRKPWNDGLYKDLYYDDVRLKNPKDYKSNRIKEIYILLRSYFSFLKKLFWFYEK